MRKHIPTYVRVPVLFFLIAGLIEYFVDSGNEPAFIKYPIVLVFLILVLVVIVSIEGIVSALDNVLFQSLDDAAKARYIANNTKTPKLFLWIKNTYINLLGQKPISQESEIVLHHDYDGIRELDNQLPPWWKYAFIISIIFAFAYMLKYEVFNGDTQIDEYETELADARISIEEYKKNAKDLVDANSVVLLTDASDLGAGKVIFETNCVACHMADGGGGIGPNLTDNNWILGGGIKNVFHTVSEGGRAGKGMIAWKQSLKPAQIAQVSSYVLSLQGTTPAKPKDAEGDVWVDDTAK
ncbi:cbb3-type cytochrome c oxidase N-terminal domain-containing protein [Formosa sp. PL04]|uniref:cbb3-type cytochrome c oxidase N-terminal domain-containing protein n=1 Tax=Formosa sp. PL04 TaxID=3081755 RepID=UPI0029828D6B|nr:cbb3-type cytochrome c oxidase N-terminal domain-containing protein [Formosa sp. PL04]MDW5288195.1 cbb3-type cytochrome c oxidase N-terminal domain-containing protein [Formosa sp. PL04]